MRVLHVIPNYVPARSYGGPIGSAHALCRHLVAAGADVVVFTTDVDGAGHMDLPLNTPVPCDGVEVHYFRGVPAVGHGVSWGLARALVTRVRAFDVVHLHTVFTASTTFGSWCCRASGVPYLVSTRGMLSEWAVQSKAAKKWLYLRAFENANLRSAAAIHATSDAEASDLRALGFERVVVIGNAVEAPPDADLVGARSLRDALSLPPRALLAVYLGRLNREKGVDIAVRAMARAPNAHLAIVGDGPKEYVSLLQQQAAQQGVTGRVHFVGWLEGANKWRALADADLLLAPSRTESYGMSIAEALAVGCPVAVSDTAPWSEIAASGAGYVVPPTEEAFANALEHAAAANDDARRRMRQAAVMVASRHRWEDRAKRLVDVYHDLAEAH